MVDWETRNSTGTHFRPYFHLDHFIFISLLITTDDQANKYIHVFG